MPSFLAPPQPSHSTDEHITHAHKSVVVKDEENRFTKDLLTHQAPNNRVFQDNGSFLHYFLQLQLQYFHKISIFLKKG